jgi:hypothetical protein
MAGCCIDIVYAIGNVRLLEILQPLFLCFGNRRPGDCPGYPCPQFNGQSRKRRSGNICYDISDPLDLVGCGCLCKLDNTPIHTLCCVLCSLVSVLCYPDQVKGAPGFLCLLFRESRCGFRGISIPLGLHLPF